MKTEINFYKNAIKTVKNTSASWLKKQMKRDLCLTFSKSGEEIDLSINMGKFGVRFNEGHFYSAHLDVLVKDKKSLIEYIKEVEKEMKNYK